MKFDSSPKQNTNPTDVSGIIAPHSELATEIRTSMNSDLPMPSRRSFLAASALASAAISFPNSAMSSPNALAINNIKNLGTVLTDLNIRAGTIYEVAIDQNGKAVIDGKSLVQKSDNTPRPVASLSKLLTVIIAKDICKKYRIDTLNERHSIKAKDINRKSKVKSIIVGERFSIEELIILSLVSSSNEAAEALARILGRRLPGADEARGKFIKEMNRFAKTEIGMSRSNFDSPSGLSAGNISTPHDISLLTLAAYNYDPKHKFGEYSINELGSEVGERNKERHNANRGLLNIMVNGVSYVPLIQKTGYIKESGKCITILVTNARKGGKMYLITLLDSTPEIKDPGVADEIRRRKVLSILEKLKTV